MFFKKFFSKSFEQILEKADSLFKAEHYSEARHLYLDALEKIPNSAGEQQSASYINAMVHKCGNRLAEMNIYEAEAAMRSGNTQKAAEYLELSLELADDVSTREKAEELIASLKELSFAGTNNTAPTGKHGCTSCDTSNHTIPETDSILPDHLQSNEQFQLLINTLPGDLPQRYLSLGAEFADAYLLAHSEQNEKALNKFRQLLSKADNDIILYETALLEYKAGRNSECESLLRRSLQLNADNPVSNLGLAQLFADTGRFDNAVDSLKSMMDRMIMYEQSLIMLADIYSIKGEQEKAIALLSTGILMPTLKKASAERLVTILSSQGRDEEAAFLFKTYLKGCC